MLVMIKNNDATELCITKRQEGTVAGWQDTYDEHGRRILDTLFVKLVDPPRKINIPGLEENIVALSRASKHVWCSFPNDMIVAILREQILVLPNFAMTNYASQGKTRIYNVVDLQHCKTHFSSSAEGTAIVQAFATKVITKGITGYLCQEFRELELLNEITRGKYMCTLPAFVSGVTRSDLLRSYQEYRGTDYDPSDLHTSLTWRTGDAPKMPPVQIVSSWSLVGKDLKPVKEITKAPSQPKRKKNEQGGQPSKKARLQTEVIKPSATMWDNVNYSCAYDALFTLLYDIWQEHPSKWSEFFAAQTKYLEVLSVGFSKFRGKSGSLEKARDTARTLLTAHFPVLFPTAMTLTSIDHLAEKIFGPTYFATESFHFLYAHPIRMFSTADYKCPLCSSNLRKHTALTASPPFLYFSVSDNNITYDTAINSLVGNSNHRYAIRGGIYLTKQHFTARLVKLNGALWYHDGILTGSTCEQDGLLHVLPPTFFNTCNVEGDIGEAVGVLYARLT
ncbi:hypothetical protein C8J57DRAFT_1439129 [Mycena rebaudengoi]|nr:hypothetical protein C8J57DRAFT_1439129 [Mycena rebaudengoi]